MSTARLTQWGNSAGLRLPAKLLNEINAYIGAEFEIIVDKKGRLYLKPVKTHHQDWLERFNRAADAQHDELLIKNMQSQFDDEEWTW